MTPFLATRRNVIAAILLAALLFTPHQVLAARSSPQPEPRPVREQLFQWSPLVLQIQDFLIEFNLFIGPADGKITADTKRAIRAYQRQIGLSTDGEPSEQLRQHMQNVGRPDSLKRRLAHARRTQIEHARDALMGNAATRDLVEPREPRTVTEPARDPDACLRTPTIDCLLGEALAAVNVITRDDYRDWALRDVIRAQARAGRMNEARAGIRQLSDLRLVLVSLREAAVALAEAGLIEEAKSLTATIPDDWNRARALLAIAEAETGKPDSGAVVQTLLDLLPRLDDKIAAVEIATDLAVRLAARGAPELALKTLDTVSRDIPENQDATDVQQIALGAMATAYARIGHTEKALELLARIGDSGRDHIALAETAAQLAKRREQDEANSTADRLRAPQLYVFALTNIAAAQLSLGDRATAKDSLERATNARLDIERPFAADVAMSRIAEIWSKINNYPRAFESARKIQNRALRAQTIWRFAVNAQSASEPDAAAEIMAQAVAATETVESPFDRAATLTQAATLFAENRQPADARAVFDMAVREARSIRNNWWRARIFSLLARTLLTLQKNA